MDAKQVEVICTHLSPLIKRTIKKNIWSRNAEEPVNYQFGEALLFWVSDYLSARKIITDMQLSLIIETFAHMFIAFGEKLERAWDKECNNLSQMKKLPSCKLGIFLDSGTACIDGCSNFLDLNTGETKPATEKLPLESWLLNLTSLFVRYHTQSRRV